LGINPIIGVGYTKLPDFVTTKEAYSTVLNGESNAIILKYLFKNHS